MKNEILTPVLKQSLDLLRTHKTLVYRNDFRHTPHWFFPEIYAETPILENYYLQTDSLKLNIYLNTANRQSINKLIALGHARYADETRTKVEYIDVSRIRLRELQDARLSRAVRKLLDAGQTFHIGGEEIKSAQDILDFADNFVYKDGFEEGDDDDNL